MPVSGRKMGVPKVATGSKVTTDPWSARSNGRRKPLLETNDERIRAEHFGHFR